MPKIHNQFGLAPLVALIIGAVVLVGGFFVLNNSGVIKTKNNSSGSNWLSQVDLTKCDQIAKRSKLSNVLIIGPENKDTYKCIAGAKDIDGTIGYLDRDGDIKIRLNSLYIDAIFDNQGVIDSKVSNIRQYRNPAPGNQPTALTSSKYWDKKYDDIFQELDFLADIPGVIDGISKGTIVITKKGTFETSEGKGAYIMITGKDTYVFNQYTSYAKAKKGHCAISMEITSEVDPKAYKTENPRDTDVNTGLDAGKTKTEKLTVELMQDIDKAIGNECGGSNSVNTTNTNSNKSSKSVNSTSTSRLDCLATVSEAADSSSAWKTLGKVTTEKGTLGKEDKDYCLLKHQSSVSNYGAGVGQVEDPVVFWTVRITYFKDNISPDKALEQLDKFKKSEKANFQTTSDSIFGYSGQTLDLSGPNYLKNVIFQGHCLVEQTVENDLTPLIKGNGVYKWSLENIKTHMSGMGGWVDGLRYSLLGNQKFSDFCK